MEQKRVGHYEVVRKLGEGGMGEVYLAHDTSLKRRVALKFLAHDLLRDESARRRFVSEARSAAALDHPFACKVHETGEADGRPYIVMEFVDGVTLKDRLTRGPIPTPEAVRIGLEVSEALECAHRHGLVHRDLKPSNIMLDPDGHVKVMDFGLAKRVPTGATDQAQATTADLTEPGMAVGTLAYMSPEQLLGGQVDARADIFSAGVVLYEMLTAVNPFQRPTPAATASAILNESPYPITRYVEAVPEVLQHTVKRMLARDPDQRFSSIHEVRTNLGEVLRDSQQVTRPVQEAALRSRRPIMARVWALAVLLLAGATAYWAFDRYFLTSTPVLAFQARDWILIVDFDNQTGDPIFDRSLKTAMTVGIQQSRYVNVFPDGRVQEALQRMRKPGVERIDETLGNEIAVREGIKGLLACSVARVGEVYSLTARLIDPKSHETVLTEARPAQGKDRILDALDSLARHVRERLGESLASISQQSTPLPKATTGSLEALKTYVESKRVAGKDPKAAFALLEQAVALDPEFAIAQADLGSQCYISGDRPKGEVHFKKALAQLDRLTQRERLWIEATVEDWRGNRNGAVGRYKTYLTQYPDDKYGWFRMGWTYMAALGQAEPAIEAFNRVLQLDPQESSALVNLATCYNLLLKSPEAIQAYERAFAMRPAEITGTFVNHEYGFTLVRVGQIEKAQSTFEKMLPLDASHKARGQRSMGLLDMYQGRYKAAAEHLREATLINKANGWALSEFRDRMFLATIYRRLGLAAEQTAELNNLAVILSKGQWAPEWLALAGTLFARAGRARDTEQLLQRAAGSMADPAAQSGVNRSSLGDQAALNQMKGEVALARGNAAEALEQFELAQRLVPSAASLESLGVVCIRLGRPKEAIARYEELLPRDELGSESQERWILAHYELGKLYQETGDAVKARERYERFLEVWKAADPEIRVVADARARLARLTGGDR